MAVMAGFIPLGTLAGIGQRRYFVCVCFSVPGVIVLRHTQPNAPRPFKIPAGVAVCVLGALSCAALIAFYPITPTSGLFIGSPLVWCCILVMAFFTLSVKFHY